MQLQIRSREGGIGPDLRASIERRARFTLGRFGKQIRQAKVYLRRSGKGNCCRIVVHLSRSAQVCLEDADGVDVETMVHRALDRTGRLVGRQLERQRGVTLIPNEIDAG
jgi:hypothetical protein